VPRQHSSGGKDRLGSISKQGDRYLRGLFTAGALAVIRYAKIYGTGHPPWLTALLARRPTKVAAIALANKLARISGLVADIAEATEQSLGACRALPNDTPRLARSSPARCHLVATCLFIF
jgi:transposase